MPWPSRSKEEPPFLKRLELLAGDFAQTAARDASALRELILPLVAAGGRVAVHGGAYYASEGMTEGYGDVDLAVCDLTSWEILSLAHGWEAIFPQQVEDGSSLALRRDDLVVEISLVQDDSLEKRVSDALLSGVVDAYEDQEGFVMKGDVGIDSLWSDTFLRMAGADHPGAFRLWIKTLARWGRPAPIRRDIAEAMSGFLHRAPAGAPLVEAVSIAHSVIALPGAKSVLQALCLAPFDRVLGIDALRHRVVISRLIEVSSTWARVGFSAWRYVLEGTGLDMKSLGAGPRWNSMAELMSLDASDSRVVERSQGLGYLDLRRMKHLALTTRVRASRIS
jgi:hypothetical protein